MKAKAFAQRPADVDDFIQEAHIALWRARQRVDEDKTPEQVEAYLTRVVLNKMKDHAKKLYGTEKAKMMWHHLTEDKFAELHDLSTDSL